MTIQLTKATYVSGVLAAAGSQHTLDAQTESYLVHIGAATWVETAYTQGRFEDAKIEYDSDGVATGIVGRANEVVGPVWATDDSGNVTGLVGPDGDLADPSARGHNGLIIFGDSLAEQSWVYSSSQNTLSSRGVANTTNMLLGNPLRPIVNAGVSGDNVAGMRARVDTAVISYLSPGDVVFIQGGINSIVAGHSASAIVDDMEYICNRLTAAGAIVSLGTVCPSTLRMTTAALTKALADVNRGYRDIAAANPNVYLSDDFVAMSLTTALNAENISTYSSDGLHPNTLGAMAIARQRAASLAGVAFKKWPLMSSNQDYKSLVFNPLAIGSNASGTNGASIGAGVSGNFCPNGYTVARTGTLAAVLSKVARTDGQAGEWARAAITGGAARDLLRWSFTIGANGIAWAALTAYPVSRIRHPSVANGFTYQVVQGGTTAATEPTWPTTVGLTVTDGTVVWVCRDLAVAGDSVEASVEFALSGWTGNAAVHAYINWLNGSSATVLQQSCNMQYTGDTLPDYTPPTGVLYLPNAVLPAGVVSGTLYVECLTTAGATGNFDLCNVSARITSR